MNGGVLCFAELGFLAQMGCGGSKVDDLALVVRCRERKELIRAAADHRYALAAAHISYFRSLKDVGDALRRFVDEELVIASPSPSSVLTLPSDEGKRKKKHISTGSSSDHKSSSSPTSLSHTGSGSISHIHSPGDDDHEGSHLHLSSDSDSELRSPSGHPHIHDSPLEEARIPFAASYPQTDWGPYGTNPASPGFGPFGLNPNPTPPAAWGSFGMNPYPPPQPGWDPYGYGMNPTSQTFYMKRSSPAVQTVIYDPDKSPGTGQVPEPSYSYSTSYSSYPYQNGGIFGFPMGSPPLGPYGNKQPSPPAEPPPPPSPKVSAWDFLNPFDMFDNGYPGYYSQNKYGYGSIASSPDSTEVREREGIPDLEDETEPETIKEVHKGKKVYEHVQKSSGEGTSRAVPSRKKSSESSSRTIPSRKHGSEGSPRVAPLHKQSSEESSRSVPFNGNGEGSTSGFPSHTSEGISVEPPSTYSETTQSVSVKEEKSSPETTLSKSTDDASVRKKGVTFEVDTAGTQDVESSRFSSLTALYAHGTRDLQEVVAEIRDEFQTASSYGKEVALMLEVGKLPYQPRFSLFKVILSRLLYLIAPTLSCSPTSSRRSVRLDFSTMKLAKSIFGDSGNMKTINLSATLDKLYAWEKKLYKEVKDEERLRVIYDKQCQRLKILDDQGAETSKIDATQASIRKLLMRLDVCIKAVDAISRRIHKLRDEELQPQVTELVHGLIRMWRAMLKCHRKQFQAIMESKIQRLRANTDLRRDSSLRATVELEVELSTWCSHFRDWMNTQRSFIESLNGWLLRCLHYEPEETPDGIAPFSPGRIGAPPVFVVCNDWFQAMEAISEKGVADAMHKFASILRQLWEKQDEEQRQRLKAEYMSKDFETRLRTLRMERGKMERDQDAISDKTGASIVPSESGVSPLDDLKVDLDSMRKKLQEERARHKEAAKLVHSAASHSLQAGLVPIFEALGNFTSEALKAYEHVRIPNAG